MLEFHVVFVVGTLEKFPEKKKRRKISNNTIKAAINDVCYVGKKFPAFCVESLVLLYPPLGTILILGISCFLGIKFFSSFPIPLKYNR